MKAFMSPSLDELFEEGPVAVIVWDTSPGWPVVYASGSVADIVGWTATELMRGDVAYENLVSPEALSRVIKEVDEALSSGRTRFTHLDYPLVRRDGTRAWVSDTTVVQRDARGAPVRLIGHIVDITERHTLAQNQVHISQRLELVLEGSGQGLWDWNPQTNEVVFNERWASMLGLEFHALAQTLETWRSRVHPDDLPRCEADIARHMRGETEFYENVHRMRHADGSWKHILDRGKIVERDAQGRPVRFSGTHTDISAQREAAISAEAAVESQRKFLATMSHEIRTPLNGILGVADLLRDSDLDEGQRHLLDLLNGSGALLKHIVDDILDLSKLEAHRLVLDPQPCAPRAVLESTLALYREQALEHAVDLQLDLHASIPERVVIDAHRLRQIVLNLVSNAIKFTEHGYVRVVADYLERQLVLTVEDTGCGIEDTDSIWLPYQQADRTISSKFGGTGLGLSIVQLLVDRMGGRITLRSAVGEGSTFCVVLPAPATQSAGYPRPREHTPAPSLDGLRVLVAEDNPVNQKIVETMLVRLGCVPEVVDNGLKAVERFERGETFDAVLLDVHMPVMDGLEAARTLRARFGDALPPLVALTADALPESRAECMAAGMVGFSSKPITRASLRRCLEETRK